MTEPPYVAVMNGYFEVCKLIMANVVDKNPISMDGTKLLNYIALGWYGLSSVCSDFNLPRSKQ